MFAVAGVERGGEASAGMDGDVDGEVGEFHLLADGAEGPAVGEEDGAVGAGAGPGAFDGGDLGDGGGELGVGAGARAADENEGAQGEEVERDFHEWREGNENGTERKTE